MNGMNDWSSVEFSLYDTAVGNNPGAFEDTFTQALYDTALFNFDIDANERAIVLDALRDRMWDEYGVDFDDVFDWEAYREAYDSGSA